MLAGVLLAASMAAPSLAYREGPLPDRVSACGFGPNCADAGCHAEFPVGSTTLSVSLTEEPGSALPLAYVPGRVYRLRLDVVDTDPASAIFGFELAPLIGCPTPTGGGDVQPVDFGRTRRIEDLGIPYLTHSCLCPTEDPTCCGYVPDSVAGSNGWSFDWTAPPRGSGDVTFAMAINAANWSATPLGDRISLAEAMIPEEACPPLIADLALRVATCDPGFPTTPRVELTWTSSGAAASIRATTDRSALAAGAMTWPLAASSCLPIDGAPITYYSVAEACALGDEGPHQ